MEKCDRRGGARNFENHVSRRLRRPVSSASNLSPEGDRCGPMGCVTVDCVLETQTALGVARVERSQPVHPSARTGREPFGDAEVKRADGCAAASAADAKGHRCSMISAPVLTISGSKPCRAIAALTAAKAATASMRSGSTSLGR